MCPVKSATDDSQLRLQLRAARAENRKLAVRVAKLEVENYTLKSKERTLVKEIEKRARAIFLEQMGAIMDRAEVIRSTGIGPARKDPVD